MSLGIQDINHIGLLVYNLESSVAFYSKVLCLKQKPRPAFGDQGAWFHIAQGQELHVIERDKENPISNNPVTHFGLRILDKDAALAHLERCDVAIESTSTRPDGATQIFIRDPDGHQVELTCNLRE